MHAPRIPPLPLVGAAPDPPALSAQPVVVPHLYCSPVSVLYNTGSICFNPNLETIDPSFYPWGLYAPPPFINAPGFVAEIPTGLLVQFCLECGIPGLQPFPPESSVDRWRRLTAGGLPSPQLQPSFEVAATPDPGSASPSAKPSGPPVALVDDSGATVLVARYWLGRDWMLHYISVAGRRGAIPIEELNFKATGEANYARGVVFVIPGWPAPQSNR